MRFWCKISFLPIFWLVCVKIWRRLPASEHKTGQDREKTS